MAVTTGYYESLPDTVRTRVQAATGYVYDLDAQFDPQARMGEISSLVGRYLNAARLGRERVEKHGEQEGNWLAPSRAYNTQARESDCRSTS